MPRQRRHVPWILACVLATLAPSWAHATPSAPAAQPIAISRPLAADGLVRIDNGAGSITVIGWDKEQVQINGTQPAAAKPPEVHADARQFTLRIHAKTEHCWLFFSCATTLLPVHLTVYVPRAARLELRTVSAVLRVQAMAGARLDVDGVSGAVDLGASRFVAARLHTVSGDLRMGAQIGVLDADTVSGNVHGADLGCTRAQVTTISGTIELGCGALTDATLRSVSGTVRLALTRLAAAGRVAVHTISGDVTLQLPTDLAAHFDLGSLSGSIGGALPAGVSVQQHRVTGTFGNGDGTLRVETVSGDVRLRQGG